MITPSTVDPCLIKRNCYSGITKKSNNCKTSTLVGTDLYSHMPILRRAIYCNGVRGPRAGLFVRFWASVGAKFTKICDSPLWTPTNHRAKFDAAGFILGEEIRICTNTQKNRKRYIHTLPIGKCG